MKINKNKLLKHTGKYCLKCKDRVFSFYRHDFKSCKCGSVFVDGGFNYFRCTMDGELINFDFNLDKLPDWVEVQDVA